tara:strand:+ start:35057 stop:35548 length:492 start_codon:yes stop_codon:yes gene_type:complete
MNQLLDHKEKEKAIKSSNLPKYITWLIGALFLINGFVGFAAFFYKMNTPLINFGFSIIQIYIGLRYVFNRATIGELILSFILLSLLTFSILSSSFSLVLKNGIFMEMGSGEKLFNSGVEYTLFYDFSHSSRAFEAKLDVIYLILLVLQLYVLTSRLFIGKSNA